MSAEVRLKMYREVDRRVYEKAISPWLPSRILDCHVHIGLAQHRGPVSPERIKQIPSIETAAPQSWEDYRAAAEMLFPDRQVSCLAFGFVYKEIDTRRENEYVLSGICEPANRADGLLVTRPSWDPELIAEAISAGFLGIKPYPDLAPQNTLEVSIYDFLPRSHLKMLDQLGGILMLHLPRAGRIADPANVREILEIYEGFPNIKLIVAHIGRAYCLPTAKKGLRHLVDAKGILFDTAANVNADVLQYALETVGPDRILYGSDLPVMLMRGVREHIGEEYFNYTDADYSWNTNRKSRDEEAGYTYFLYEELKAIIAAVNRCGLGQDATEKVFYSNCDSLLRTCAGRLAPSRYPLAPASRQ